jgi:ribosomal protein S18 acetylase RimI-like enzyme
VAVSDYSIVERNLRAAMKFFGRASGTGDIKERDGVLLIDSGVGYSVFNIAMLTAPVSSAEMLAARIRTAAEHYNQRGTRWSMWLCEEMLDARVRPRVSTLFAGEGLRRLTDAPGMIAARLRPPERSLPAVESRRVNDATTRGDFAHITSLNFDIPFATCQIVYGNSGAWVHDYHGYVAYVRGAPVASAAVVIAEGSIGLYSVSTLMQFRHKGYAEALMRDVIRSYAEQTGLERTVLQATRLGYEMYLKMGYRPVSRFVVYMS